MKRWIKITFILLAQLILVLRSCEATTTVSQSFRLIVVIPAIVGINVPDPDGMIQNPIAAEMLGSQNVASNMPTEIVVSTRMENNQKMIYQTLVVK